MSVFRPSTMLLKNNELCLSFHDVDEKKGERRLNARQRKIGSSVHRLIDPSAGRGGGFRWPDDPMVRWPDHKSSGEWQEKAKGQ